MFLVRFNSFSCSRQAPMMGCCSDSVSENPCYCRHTERKKFLFFYCVLFSVIKLVEFLLNLKYFKEEIMENYCLNYGQ